jgi:hypothetical protein
MKDTLKYIAIIVACIVGAIALVRLGSCGGRDSDEVTTRIPQDSSFAPVTEREMRPRSTPFEKPSNAPARLPKGLTEANVARIVRVVKRIPVDSSHSILDTTSVIVTKGDQVFVPKQEGIQTAVEDTKFAPPIFRFGTFASVGISLVKLGIPNLEVSPSIAIAPLEILGKIQLPLITADLQGVGIGVGYRYKDFVFAIAGHQRFENARRSVRIMIHYSI